MDKKFVITIPYENDFSDEQRMNLAEFEIACEKNYVNDLIKIYGSISLNEVIRRFRFLKHKTYSYRWGWDLRKHGCVDIKVIENPISDYIWYMQFTAYDIVG